MDDQQSVYAEWATSVNVADIASNANVETLRRLRENDPDLKVLVLWDEIHRTEDGNHYCPSGDEDMGWAGHFIGNNTNLEQLILYNPTTLEESNSSLLPFFRELSRNRTIEALFLREFDLSGGDILQAMEPFFQSNSNLRGLEVAGREPRAPCDRLLLSTIQRCHSLEFIVLQDCLDDETSPRGIIEALNKHTQLQGIQLLKLNVGSSEFRALSSIPRFSNLTELSLVNNQIGYEGVQALTGAVTDGGALQLLDISHNQSITSRGWQCIANMLKSPTNLEELYLLWNNVDDDQAEMFAVALGENSTLKILGLIRSKPHDVIARELGIEAEDNRISGRGVRSLSRALCNTTSIDATFASNHTLTGFSVGRRHWRWQHLSFPLRMNRREEGDAARRKIIEYHLNDDIGMQRFTHMDRAILPHFIAWVPNDELSLCYRFVKYLPTELGFCNHPESSSRTGPQRKRQRS